MKLSVSSLLYIKYPRREAFASLQRLGVTCVDLWDHPGFGSHVAVSTDDSTAVSADLVEFGLKPSAISLYDSDPKRMTDGINYAAKVGAPMVVAGFSGSNPEEFAAFLRPLVAVATRVGVKIAIENHVDTPADSIDRWKTLAELVPGLVCCYAPPHAVYMGENQCQNLTTLGDRMAMFYLWDCPWASTGLTWFRNNWNQCSEEQFPGRGKLTPLFPAIMDTLRATRFAGSVNLLVHGSREWSIEKTEAHITASRRFLGL
ncbi:MAG: sugar phosphate isomerase/epimerase [Opitutaceae bacterium]|nr:sugar phosphate isomerase/epimerase [Opitutaceae bacterium]